MKPRYLNPESSLLAFHGRVLDQAEREDLTLRERLSFLSIACSNLDEFFAVKLAAWIQRATYGVGASSLDGLSAQAQVEHLTTQAQAFIRRREQLAQVLIRELESLGLTLNNEVHLRKEDAPLHREQRLRFEREYLPLLTPVVLDETRPFPRVVNGRTQLLVELAGKDSLGRRGGLAVISLAPPHIMPSFELVGTHHYEGRMTQLTRHLDLLFPKMRIKAVYPFRVLRDAELWVDEEEAEDLLSAVSHGLTRRQFGEVVWAEIDAATPEHLKQRLSEELELPLERFSNWSAPYEIGALNQLPHLKERLSHQVSRSQSWPVGTLPHWSQHPFEALREQARLLHHPYESLEAYAELLRVAARDPMTLSIHQTLYRAEEASPVVDALVEAATRGKDVHVLIELRARFDEAHNVELAHTLRAAGVTVALGVRGLKTHAKLGVVTRMEEGQLAHYVHVGTGNYNLKTSGIYTDFSYFSRSRELGREALGLFRQLFGAGERARGRLLIVAPRDMRRYWVKRLRKEAERARKGLAAHVWARMNALNDPEMVDALQDAAQAGVKIRLLVRGQCALIPKRYASGGFVSVRSFVGVFLEHSRVIAFGRRGERGVFISSADWRPRNLSRRIEVAVRIRERALARRALHEGIGIYFRSGLRIYRLGSDGFYRLRASGQAALDPQEALVRDLGEP